MKKYTKKFTEKRDPYKSYNLAKWNWNDVFLEIEELKKVISEGYMKQISKKYGIRYKTLLNKYSQFKKGKLNILEENRGIGNKIFSHDQENEIFLYLKEYFIDK